MSLANLQVTTLRDWDIQLIPVTPAAATKCYQYIIFGQNRSKYYKSQQIYPTKLAAYQAAYFFCCRAELDNQVEAALILERKSGHIMALNLPAFELLAINAVGLSFTDFVIDQASDQGPDDCLAPGISSGQIARLCNADGDIINCQIQVTCEPCLPQLSILHLHHQLQNSSILS